MTSIIIRLKNVVGSEVFRNSAVALSLAVALVSFATAYLQSRRVQSLQFLLRASEQAPALKPLGEPRILELDVDLDYDVEIREATLILKRLVTELEVENTADATGSLSMFLSGDAFMRTALLRDKLLGAYPEVELSNAYTDAFWTGRRQLSRGDTIRLEFDTPLRGLQGNAFILHYLMLYRNVAGMLYDSYYWVTFRVTPVDCNTESTTSSPCVWHVYHSGHKVEVCFTITVEHTNAEVHVYSEGETAIVTQLNRSLSTAHEYGFEVWRDLKSPYMPDEELPSAR